MSRILRTRLLTSHSGVAWSTQFSLKTRHTLCKDADGASSDQFFSRVPPLVLGGLQITASRHRLLSHLDKRSFLHAGKHFNDGANFAVPRRLPWKGVHKLVQGDQSAQPILKFLILAGYHRISRISPISRTATCMRLNHHNLVFSVQHYQRTTYGH